MPRFKIRERVRISKYDLSFRKGNKPKFAQEFFEIVAICSRKPPTYKIKDGQDEIIRGKFYQKELISHLTMELFTIEMFSNVSAQLFPDNTNSPITDFLAEQLNLEGEWEVAIPEKFYPFMYQNVTEEKFLFFDEKLSEPPEFYYLAPGLYPSVTYIVEARNTLCQERHNHSENRITVKTSRKTPKADIYLANEENGLALFNTDLGQIFGSNVGNEIG